VVPGAAVKKEKKQGISFKEKKEFELLSAEIQNLEAERNLIESQMSIGSLTPEDLYSKSIRHGEIVKALDDKEMRWLELSEK
jgi:ATP-binding cassette subfamily F protein uup